jgi:hypothetical protein
MSRPSVRTFALAAAILVGTVSAALATTALYVTDAEQAELSTAVVIARVGVAEVLPHDRYETVMTRTTLVIDDVLYGTAPEQVLLHQVGGTLDGRTVHVPGDAKFELGERCVLFLRQVEGRWYLTAMEQSKYLLNDHPRFGPLMTRELSAGLRTRDSRGALVAYRPGVRSPMKRLVSFRSSMDKLQTEQGGQ